MNILLFCEPEGRRGISSAPRARGHHRDAASYDAFGGDAPRDDRNLGRDDLNHDALDGPDRQHEPRSQKQPLRESSRKVCRGIFIRND